MQIIATCFGLRLSCDHEQDAVSNLAQVYCKDVSGYRRSPRRYRGRV